MDVQIELSMAEWHSLFGYLDPNSSIFSAVKNAIEANEAPLTTPIGKVALSCSENDAAVMLEIAQKHLPELAPIIRKALKR